ncbi:gluconate 2-dehydrogenase subunit 3 family protein [Segetibacter koreensis]|uniref:gluconate 2-dehydrogenase subunit 3 family protein n=1 Tax=Segetibacter koreensis TaxID=398037 RepID=UPI00036BA09C|nr:gluconate 2-dehydrogenase subunit 3 family protein [Segetibacter koreensis]
MKRRTAVRNLFFIAGGITIIPSCLSSPEKASIALNNFTITRDQENILAEIASIIIPQTNTPGAKEVGAHLFVLKMLDDCYEKDIQQKFVQGLDQLENCTKVNLGRSFLKCTNAQKQRILEGVESKQGYSQEVVDFYRIMKERTIQGYMTSKFVVMNIQKYEIIPSVKYNGYYPIKSK